MLLICARKQYEQYELNRQYFIKAQFISNIIFFYYL